MLLRIVPVFIVTFWLVSVAWLCAVIWAPPESRMAQVDPRQVYDVFFAWNESTNMTLLDNGTRRGQITIAGSSGDDLETGEFVKTLSVSGVLERPDEEAGVPGLNTDLFVRGLLDFSEVLHLMGGSFSVRVPKQELTGHFEMDRKEGSDTAVIDKDSFHLRARATLAGNQIFAFDSEKSDGPGTSSLPLSMIPMQSMIDLKSLDPSQWQLENDARVGSFTIGGRELRAYLVSFRKKDSEGSVRVFLSEVGEPLRIETDFGVEAVSEILVPLDAYLEKKDNNES